jgi:tetraprenyl-beta-curcumene synthase
MTVPNCLVSLIFGIYRQVRPAVQKGLIYWQDKAQQIPDPELRHQALTSISTKKFHCEGGSIYGLLAVNHLDQTINFIIAYQTLCDYLDNLCDRSTSLDPKDFSALHESVMHALTPGAESTEYYRFHPEKDDGGYLTTLVKTCQNILQELPGYQKISHTLYELAENYCNLQIHKHVKIIERVPRLKAWFATQPSCIPSVSWYEFAACTGSTLGIFCLVAYAWQENFTEKLSEKIKNSYFPWVQGLHILLDYFIDQEEDRLAGDLNFCSYYQNNDVMIERFQLFFKEADQSVADLPNKNFHRAINRALLGVYLADQKTNQVSIKEAAKQIISFGGNSALIIRLNTLLISRFTSKPILLGG